MKSTELNIPRQEVGKIAVKTFGNNHPWSDKKVRYLLDQRYKQIYRVNNALSRLDEKQLQKLADRLDKEIAEKQKQKKSIMMKLAEPLYEVTRFMK